MDHKDMILHLMVVIKEARSLQMPMWLLNSSLLMMQKPILLLLDGAAAIAAGS